MLTTGQFPYIDFEAKTYLQRQNLEEIPENLRTPHFAKMKNLHETYPIYTGSAGLQAPTTLDGSYYDMLNEKKLLARDGDQVVLKWFGVKEVKQGDYLKTSRQYFENRSRSVESLSADEVQSSNQMPSTDVTVDGQRSAEPSKPLPCKAGVTKQEDVPKMLMIHQLWLWKLCDSMFHLPSLRLISGMRWSCT
jgi:hypothetical protein